MGSWNYWIPLSLKQGDMLEDLASIHFQGDIPRDSIEGLMGLRWTKEAAFVLRGLNVPRQVGNLNQCHAFVRQKTGQIDRSKVGTSAKRREGAGKPPTSFMELQIPHDIFSHFLVHFPRAHNSI